MIFSRGNLVIVEMTKADNKIPQLDNVHFRKDGSTVATNGASVIAVSPVSSEVIEKLPIKSSEMLFDETISAESVKEVVRNVKVDRKFGGLLEHVDLKDGSFKITDGKREKIISAKKSDREYLDYAKEFKLIHTAKVLARAEVNLKRFLSVLDSINKICGDVSAYTSVYIDFTSRGDIVLRAENAKTKQKILSFFKSYSSSDVDWKDFSFWERTISGVNSIIGKIRKIRKIKKRSIQ